MILGASFDTPEENLAFAKAQRFDYPLLSDVDRSAGRAYEALRAPDEQYADYALRVAYLIGPKGDIARTYEVTDVAGFADAVLADLRALQAG
jgi:peroxiredoxin